MIRYASLLISMVTPAARTHVLIADDYPGMAELLADLLTDLSDAEITTDVVLNGAEAVALARAHPPDMALLDIDMPVMSGFEAAIAIKAVQPDTPPLLVAMTGNPFSPIAIKARDTFDAVLAKPVDLDVLTGLLEIVATRGET